MFVICFIGVVVFIIAAVIYGIIAHSMKDLAKFGEKYQKDYRKHLIITIVCVVLAVFSAVGVAVAPSTSSGISTTDKSDTRTCKVCGRSFPSISASGKKILTTNMCEQCYKNFNYATGK